NAALRQRRLCRHRRLAPGLRGRADLVAEDADRGVDRLEVDLLREVEAQLVAHDLAGDQYHRRAVAVAFGQAVYEVQAARPARSRAGGKLAGQHRVGAGREPSRFLVADMDPADSAV